MGVASDSTNGYVYATFRSWSAVGRLRDTATGAWGTPETLTPPGDGYALPWGVAVEPGTLRVYVTDLWRCKVHVFDKAGAYLFTFG